MACLLNATVSGSLGATTFTLLQGDIKLTFWAVHFYIHYTELDASISGSLNASTEPILVSSITGSLDASTKITLNARYCQRIQVAI